MYIHTVLDPQLLYTDGVNQDLAPAEGLIQKMYIQAQCRLGHFAINNLFSCEIQSIGMCDSISILIH